MKSFWLEDFGSIPCCNARGFLTPTIMTLAHAFNSFVVVVGDDLYNYMCIIRWVIIQCGEKYETPAFWLYISFHAVIIFSVKLTDNYKSKYIIIYVYAITVNGLEILKHHHIKWWWRLLQPIAIQTWEGARQSFLFRPSRNPSS